MCTAKERVIIHNINRCFIGLAGTAGCLLDGFHVGDIFCFVSLSIWLLQAECRALEEKLLDKLKYRNLPTN